MPRKKMPGYSGLVILALFLGAVFLGADIALLDSLVIAAPIWLALALAYLARAIWRAVRSADKGGVIAASLVALCYIALAILLFRPLWNPAPQIDGKKSIVRVVSFNINKDNPDPQAVVRWIESVSPDFVILLEARDREGSVARRLKARYPYRYDCRGDGYCSTIILARSPAVEVVHHARGDTENRRSLSALSARFNAVDRPLTITAAHMPHPAPVGDQGARLRELAASTGRPVGAHLVVGDFNNVPWTFAMNRLAADMDLRLMSKAIPSWPTAMGWGAFLPIDNIYGSGCVATKSISRGPRLGSDHYPLVLTATLGDCRGL